jgi:hypothetical protein
MTEFRFLSSFSPAVGILLTLVAAAIAWWLYWREVHDFPAPYRWLLPTLRAVAIALVIVMLLEPSLRFRYFEGTPTRLQVWVDATQSMSENDARLSDQQLNGQQPTLSRYDRALDALIQGDSPQLEQWSQKGEVVLGRFGGDKSAVLWQSTLQQPNEIPVDESSLRASEWYRPTSLSHILAREKQRLGVKDPSESDATLTSSRSGEQSQPILLFTDGQHNSGVEPLEVMQGWPKETAPIYIVGMGESSAPQSVTLLGVDSPQQLYRSDRLQGTIQLQDGLAAGTPYEVSIYHQSKLLWSESRSSDGPSGGPSGAPGEKRVPFSFTIEELVKQLEATLPDGQQAQRLTIPLEAKVKVAGEVAPNPLTSTHSWLIGVTTRKQRILLLDSRSRWETRYLRNALERDPQWELDAYLVAPGESPKWFSQNIAEVSFPQEPYQFEKYDLIVSGEMEPESLSAEVLQNLQHTIQRGGAGWIVIDGKRGYWQQDAFRSLRPLLPIEWRPEIDGDTESLWMIKPVVDSTYSSVLDLSEGDERKSADVWNQLPGFRTLVPVKELPGSQVMATSERLGVTLPFMVTRTAGAGRVVYFASDESWRWRFEVADKIHQRFWSQVSRWCMRAPFAVESEYVALDSGEPVYSLGQTVPLRARVRDSAGEPSVLPQVEAVIKKGDTQVATTTLTVEADMPGTYRGQVLGLAPGDYEVSLLLPGFSTEAAAVKSLFRVLEPANPEMLKVTRNDTLLSQIAALSGGKYVTENQIDELWAAMKLRHNSKLIESDQLLWQSFWWFIPIVLIIAVEWWLRKKAGLI